MMKNVILFLSILAVVVPAGAQSVEDEILIETEAAMADSEAALQEAVEVERSAREEKRRADRNIAKAKMQMERARKKEEEGKRRIAKAEREKVQAQDASDKAAVDMETAKARIESIKEDIKVVQNQLEEANANRSLATEKRDLVLGQMKDVQADLQANRRKLAEVKKEELSALKDLKRAETRLSFLQDKAKISYKNADKDAEKFMSAVKDHREALLKISKRLDELEVEVETDRNYYAEERKNKVVRSIGSTSNRSATKVAKVMSVGCNIRNSPTSQSAVVGKSRRGSKVRIRSYNKGWYSVIHDGEKAFIHKLAPQKAEISNKIGIEIRNLILFDTDMEV